MNIFVAKTGNDANAGTKNSPFLTLGRAQEEARRNPGSTVTVSAGEYRENLVFEKEDSGTRWTGEEGAVLTGGAVLTEKERIALPGEFAARLTQDAAEKKKLDCSKAEFHTVDEGLCVQIMHIGPFDREPEIVAAMDRYIAENGYENDLSNTRLHHEIYLSDTRKVPPEKWKTVIRYPIRKA